MNTTAARIVATAMSLALLGAGCDGDGGGEPSSSDNAGASTTAPEPGGNVVPPTAAVTYLTGTGTVEVSGGSVTAPTTLNFSTLSEDSGYDPADVASITFNNEDGTSMQVAWRPGGDPEGTPSVVRIGLTSSVEDSYMDADRTQCRVTLDSLDATTVSGSFQCQDLPGLFEADKSIGSARGTFTARA